MRYLHVRPVLRIQNAAAKIRRGYDRADVKLEFDEFDMSRQCRRATAGPGESNGLRRPSNEGDDLPVSNRSGKDKTIRFNRYGRTSASRFSLRCSPTGRYARRSGRFCCSTANVSCDFFVYRSRRPRSARARPAIPGRNHQLVFAARHRKRTKPSDTRCLARNAIIRSAVRGKFLRSNHSVTRLYFSLIRLSAAECFIKK